MNFFHVHIVQEAPIHQSHVYGGIKILRTIFEKGHPRSIPVKLFQNRISGFWEEDFLRISSCLYSAKIPHSPEPCLWMDQNFANIFWKGSHKEHSCEIISKSDQRFQRRRFFKNLLLHVHMVQEAPIHQSHVYGRIKISRTFWKGSPKEHSCKITSKSDQQFSEKKIF